MSVKKVQIKQEISSHGKGGRKIGRFASKGGGKRASKAGAGGAKGNAGGQWLFVPAGAAAPMQQRFGRGRKGSKGQGQAVQQVLKGVRNGGGQGGKKGNDKYKFMDQLDKIDAERKVWVGGLPENLKRGNLEKHFKEVIQPSMYEIMSKGTACIAFKTAEDAESAIASLNGSELEGKSIEVDVWTKKEKKERPEGEKRERRKKVKSVVKTSFLKGKGKTPENSKIKEQLREIDHSLKVWVGGLSDKTTWKQLKQHFVDNGADADVADLMKKGTACITFKTEDEVSSAVASINGTEIDGQTIQVDVWTKPEKREKKIKAEL